ncbi:hypothetical protein ULMS_09240 [Patiriisocius marinistellae]|uniref:Uncharacterized protein n=1 Tax=Patiriisocius marinistellae TaxID=2494560 RepID=A0A5J4FZ22_9FLAO|nr:hypothetical protein [Patiriisocius marinistellae]GEQ85416.1 hypothetical protein ULMS_09240 [Patiriisocius marinistellae]
MYQRLLSQIEQSTSFDFGNVLSKSFELFKKVWVEGFVHLLLMMVISIPVIILMYVGMFAILGVNFFIAGGAERFEGANGFDPAMIPSFVGLFLLILIVSALMQTFSIAIMAHFYQVCKKADTGKPMDTGGYFDYLKKASFKKLFLLSLATMGVALIAMLLCYLPLFYVMVPLSLSGVIFAFNPDLMAKENISASFKLGNKYWLPIFGLLILGGLIAYLGVLACGVGLFFTAMFAYIPIYYVYKDTIGFDDDPSDAAISEIEKF